jgi:hypothetical protein
MSEPMPDVSRQAVLYGNDSTGEVIAITQTYGAGQIFTIMRMRYPDPKYPESTGAGCSDVLLRTGSRAAVKQWLAEMQAGQTHGKFVKLKRWFAEGAPVQVEMTDERLPNPQPYTETSWGDTDSYGPDADTGHPQ